MDTFSLLDLILFWKEQRGKNFSDIIMLLDIIDDDDIPDSRKRNLIMSLLHVEGLFELGHSENAKGQVAQVEWISKSGVKFNLEILRCEIMNAVVDFHHNLN